MAKVATVIDSSALYLLFSPLLLLPFSIDHCNFVSLIVDVSLSVCCCCFTVTEVYAQVVVVAAVTVVVVEYVV